MLMILLRSIGRAIELAAGLLVFVRVPLFELAAVACIVAAVGALAGVWWAVLTLGVAFALKATEWDRAEAVVDDEPAQPRRIPADRRSAAA